MAIHISTVNLNGCNFEGAYDLIEQYVDTNKSKVRFYGILHVTNNYVSWSSGNAYVYYSGDKALNTYYSQGDYTVVQYDTILEHNAEGKLENYLVNSGLHSTFTSGDSNGRITLPTIPRASSVSASDTYVGDTTTIAITRASSSFKHNLTYSFESLTGTIATNVDTSYTWTIPTSFYDKLKTKQSATCTITCQTLKDSTVIGTKTTTFKISVNPTTNAPTGTLTIVDSNSTTRNLTGDETKLVRYRSNANITLVASAKNGATISTRTVRNGSTTLTNDGTINQVSDNKFYVTIIDSRGLTTTFTQEPTMVDYINKSWTARFYRTSATGSEIAVQYSGNFFNGSFGAVTNTLTVEYQSRLQGSDTWSSWTTLTPTINGNSFSQTIALSGEFPYTNSYEFRMRFTDRVVANTSATYKVSPGVPIFDWGASDFAFHVPVYMKNGNPILDYNLNGSVATLIGKYLNIDSLRDSSGNSVIGFKRMYTASGTTFTIPYTMNRLRTAYHSIKIQVIQKKNVSERVSLQLKFVAGETISNTLIMSTKTVRTGTSGSATSQSSLSATNDYLVSTPGASTGFTVGFFIPDKHSYNELELSNFNYANQGGLLGMGESFTLHNVRAYCINGSQLYLDSLSSIAVYGSPAVSSQTALENGHLVLALSDDSDLTGTKIIIEAI